MNTEDSLIIPPNLFSEDKPLVLIDIPSCKNSIFFDFIKTSTISQMKVFFNKMDYKESNKFVVDGFIVNGLTDLLWTGLVDNPPHDSDLEKHLKKNIQHS